MNPISTRSALAACVTLLAAVGTASATGLPPGSLDPDFGIGGRTTHDFHNRDDRARAVMPLKDGRFLVAGEVTGPNIEGPGFTSNFTVSRFLPDGRIDPTFGVDGTMELDTDAHFDNAEALALLPDGSIIVGGALAHGAYSDFAIAKLTPDGDLDTTFGMDVGGERTGWNILDTGGPNVHDDIVDIAVQRNGRIVAVGVTRVQVGNFHYQRVAAARFMPDGTVDTSFGGNNTGFTVLAPFAADDAGDFATSLALDYRNKLPANDSITVVGYTFARNNAFVARLTANGLVDSSFGTGGRVTFSSSSSGGVYSGASRFEGARLVAGGKIALLGTGGDRGFTFMRLHPNGTLDTTFGSNGRTLVKFSDGSREDEPFSLAVQGNGRLVATGYAINTATGFPRDDVFVARVNANGTVDNSFGDGQGRAVVQVVPERDQGASVQVEPSGNLLVAGFAVSGGATAEDYALVRLIGDPDRIFWYDHEIPEWD
jgi:uncharacterized delta-60 repeat protein